MANIKSFWYQIWYSVFIMPTSSCGATWLSKEASAGSFSISYIFYFDILLLSSQHRREKGSFKTTAVGGLSFLWSFYHLIIKFHLINQAYHTMSYSSSKSGSLISTHCRHWKWCSFMKCWNHFACHTYVISNHFARPSPVQSVIYGRLL